MGTDSSVVRGRYTGILYEVRRLYFGGKSALVYTRGSGPVTMFLPNKDVVHVPDDAPPFSEWPRP